MSTDEATLTETQRGRTSHFRLPALCAGLMLILWGLQAHPYLNVANDAGRYMVLGESLARTGELRLINDPLQPLDTLYPPGFPLLIAFWLKVTGRDPGGVVRLIKLTQVLLLLGLLPLFATLLEKARLPVGYRAAALLTLALCPALAAYANDVMAEVPFLFLSLASVALVERDLRLAAKEDNPAGWKRVLSLVCAGAAFLMRTAGIALLLAQMVWFWRRFGWKWGLIATAAALSVAGGWQLRNRHILRHAPPGVHYPTYRDQFTYRDPMDPHAGRIELNAHDLLERAVHSFPIYIGMIPRAPLNSMSRGTAWFYVFYAVAVPFTLLLFLGYGLGWKRGLSLSGGFTAVFWLFAAMWPWRDARFLVPLIPWMLLYVFLGVHWLSDRLRAYPDAVRIAQGVAAFLLLAYFLEVHAATIRRENRPTFPGYALGRTREEGGFYAACAWLKQNGAPGSLVMGRPAYLLHLYSDHPTTQIEPHFNPRVQEKQYMQARKVRYLVQDAWSWANTDKYLGPYLRDFGDRWRLAWEDPNRSGVRIWERLDQIPAPPPPNSFPTPSP